MFGSISSSIEEHAQKVAEVDQRYRQIGRRSFQGRVQGLRRPEATIFRESTYPEVLQEGWSDWPGVVIVIPAKASGGACFSGHRIAPGQMAVMSGGREFLFRTPAELHLDVILIADEFARVVLGTEIAQSIGKGIVVRDLRPGLHQSVREGISRLLASPSGIEPLANPNADRELPYYGTLEQMLSSLLNESMRQEFTDQATRPRMGGCAELTLKALECIHDNLDEPPNILGLCRLLGVSRRHLQRCFEQTLQLNPSEYVLRQRLLRARQLLLRRRGSCRNVVTSVALECGFGHLGRFSGYYRRMFGEYPEPTASQRVKVGETAIAPTLAMDFP